MKPTVSAAIAVVITVVWALSMIIDVISKSYEPPAAIHGALMLVLGGVFGQRMVSQDGGN